MVAHVFGSRSTRFASRSAVGSETQIDIDAPRIPCVHACVVWSAKKLIIDLEIAFLPLHLLFKAVEIGKLIKRYSLPLLRFILAETTLENQSPCNNKSRADWMKIYKRFNVCLNDIQTVNESRVPLKLRCWNLSIYLFLLTFILYDEVSK